MWTKSLTHCSPSWTFRSLCCSSQIFELWQAALQAVAAVVSELLVVTGKGNDGSKTCHSGAISQLPKLCMKISILVHRHMWVRSFSTRLTSVTFAEDKVLIFLILRKNAKIVQLLSLTIILTLISWADWSDIRVVYCRTVHCFLKIWSNKRTHPNERRHRQRPPCCHSWRHSWWRRNRQQNGNRPISYQDEFSRII